MPESTESRAAAAFRRRRRTRAAMQLTRRDLGRSTIAGLATLAGTSLGDRWASPLLAQALASRNRSYFNGVQFGVQPFCYHDLAMTPENRGELIRRLVQNGMGMVELHNTWVEPRFNTPGVAIDT